MFDAVEGYIHEDWTGDVGDGYDIAVLKLDRKSKGLKLPRLGTGDITITAGDLLAATGWGMTESTAVAKKLRLAEKLAVIEQKYCKEPPSATDAGSWICAGGLGEDTCKGNASRRFRIVYRTAIHSRLAATGDSGGPLLLADAPKRYIEKGNPRFDVVVGITSYGYGDGESDQCSGFEPAIYTSVDYFRDWIEETIEHRSKVSQILTNTTCDTMIT